MSDLTISLELTNGAGRSGLNLMSKSTPLKSSTSNGSCHQPGTSLGLQSIPSPPVPSKSNNVSNKTSNLSHVPCKFFKQGTCTAGTNCTFSHNLTPNSESSVCKYFIKGNCKFGTKCALLHTMSPYGDNRKYISSWSSPSHLQQQYQQQNHHTLSDPHSTRQTNNNGFSQLTAAIQQQQQQQQQHIQGLSTSIPSNNPLYQYRPPQGNSIKHPGISSLRTTPSVWDPATTNSSLNNNKNSFIDTNGYLQRIPETERYDGFRQLYDGGYQSSSSLGNLSKSYDPWTRHSSRFFASPLDHHGSSQTSTASNIHSYSFQAQNPSSLQGSFDRLGTDTLLGTSTNAGSHTDISDIWSHPMGFNERFDTSSANAINIPGMNSSILQVPSEDVALRRRPLYQQQQQQQPSYYQPPSNTPEPSSFISPFTEDRQRPRHSTHDETDAPFFMEDTEEEDGPTPDQQRQDNNTQNQTLGFPSFTSLVRPTY